MMNPGASNPSVDAAAAPSLIGALERHATLGGDKVALSYLDRGETLTDQVTYAALWRESRVIAGALAAAGLSGRPVLIALPQGLDFVRCFLACLIAGAIATPTPFPVERRSAARAASIMRAARPAAVVTTSAALAVKSRSACFVRAEGPPCPLLDVGDLRAGAQHVGPQASQDRIAFLQFTSGSVSQPKGVAITLGNIAGNLRMIAEAFRADEATSLVSWLPLHHDMGLIGCVLEPLFLGADCTLMSPLAFLQKPIRWLRALETFGANTAGSPNFGYELCARQVSDAEARKLDLSRWKLAFCGSEPIRPAAQRRFAERFAVSGFDPKAQLACYGQAEATLLISATRPGDGLSNLDLPTAVGERRIVCCGKPVAGTHMVVLPPLDGRDPEGEGEICVSGPQVSPGFWDGEIAAARADERREVRVNGQRYLRTGDAGRVIDGEIYIVGRLRDMIIVHGANIHAEDVEATVMEADGDGLLSAAAAFGLETGDREQLVVVCEVKRGGTSADPAALTADFSRAISQAHGVLPWEVLLVSSGAVERTVSGKIQRAATRARYLAGALARIPARAPSPVSAESCC